MISPTNKLFGRSGYFSPKQGIDKQLSYSRFFTKGNTVSGTDKPNIGEMIKPDPKKANSIILPLGNQKVYVPSKRLEAQWHEKIQLVKKYLMLPDDEKEIKIMELSLKKFYKSVGRAAPILESRDDLEKTFAFICNAIPKDQVVLNKKNDSNELALLSSIVMTVNKFFTKTDFDSKIRIQSITEYFWHYVIDNDYIFPFTSLHEDLHTMVQMGLPYLDETTLYHEVGVGSGEGIIDVLLSGYDTDKMPGLIIGTDVNPFSLESIKLLIEEAFGGFDNVYLRYGNGADPLENIPLGFTPKVVVLGANRFFSILDPCVFNSMVDGFQQQMQEEGYLIAGITLNSPKNIQQLETLVMKKNPGRYSLEDCDYGKVLYLNNPFDNYLEKSGSDQKKLIETIHQVTGLQKDKIDISKVVRQVYYDPDKFKSGVVTHSFEVIESKVVQQRRHDEREVFLFKKKSSVNRS